MYVHNLCIASIFATFIGSAHVKVSNWNLGKGVIYKFLKGPCYNVMILVYLLLRSNSYINS